MVWAHKAKEVGARLGKHGNKKALEVSTGKATARA
jgi:hypothetical protein